MHPNSITHDSSERGKERQREKTETSPDQRLPTSETDKQSPFNACYGFISPSTFASCIICTSLENQLKPCCNGLRGINHYPIDAPVKIKVYDTRVLVKIEQHTISPNPSHRLLVKNWSERDVVPHIRRIIIIYPDSFSVPVSCFTPIPAIRIVISLQHEAIRLILHTNQHVFPPIIIDIVHLHLGSFLLKQIPVIWSQS